MSQDSVSYWLTLLIERLEETATMQNAPALDIEWLILRCADTLRYHGTMRDASLRELRRSLETFHDEFPDIPIPDFPTA